MSAISDSADEKAADDQATETAAETLIEVKPAQTIMDILVNGEEPTEEFLEMFRELENVPQVSDDELEKQALNAPGDDGDPTTPE